MIAVARLPVLFGADFRRAHLGLRDGRQPVAGCVGGLTLHLQFDELSLDRETVAHYENGFAIKFALSPSVSAALIRHIHSGGYQAQIEEIRPTAVLGALTQRIFR